MVCVGQEAVHFIKRRKHEIAEARQNAAFFLTSGLDFSTALRQRGDKRKAIIIRLGRLLERERLKGVQQHWSYDLNRHIALKQAYDRLKRDEGEGAEQNE